MKSIYLTLLVATFAMACGKASKTRATDSASSNVVSAPVAANSATPSSTVDTSPCPHDGKWALCSVEKRLKQSGFVVKRVDHDTTRRTGFSVRPAVYTLGQSRLEIFLYSDSASVAKDVAKLDTLTVGPPGSPSQWGEVPPMLIRSANLAAVLLSTSATQAERVSLALTAGPPQAGSPR